MIFGYRFVVLFVINIDTIICILQNTLIVLCGKFYYKSVL